MLVENNGPVEYTDKDRASKMLEIVCNMYKCKYAILLNNFVESPNMRFTLLINIQSIIRDWLILCGEECDFDSITDEEITARLLEVVIHYRRFFEDKVYCQKTWVFLYYSYNTKIDGLFESPLFSEWISNPKDLQRKVGMAIKIIYDITKFIPGLYFILHQHDDVNISTIPYFIIHELTSKSDNEKIHITHSVLVVSGNDLDFTSLGLLDLNGDFKIYGFKRRHPTLFTNEDILNKLIYPHRKTNLKTLPMYISSYPILMLTQINTITDFKNEFDFKSLPSFESTRKLIMKEIGKIFTLGSNSYDEMSTIISNCESLIYSNEFMTKLYKYINIPDVMKNYYTFLKSNKTLWKIDMIDYSIEELNDRYFLHYKIDFKALF